MWYLTSVIHFQSHPGCIHASKPVFCIMTLTKITRLLRGKKWIRHFQCVHHFGFISAIQYSFIHIHTLIDFYLKNVYTVLRIGDWGIWVSRDSSSWTNWKMEPNVNVLGLKKKKKLNSKTIHYCTNTIYHPRIYLQ